MESEDHTYREEVTQKAGFLQWALNPMSSRGPDFRDEATGWNIIDFFRELESVSRKLMAGIAFGWIKRLAIKEPIHHRDSRSERA